MKVFLACPKGMLETDMEEARKDVQGYLSAKNNTTVQVVLSSDDYTQNFANCGGWMEWIDRVAKGMDYTTRKQIYQAVVCTDMEMGRATANIVEQSVSSGKPVLYWNKETKEMKRVASVLIVDESNWQTGWSLNLI